MEDNNLRTNTLINFIWRFAERISAQLISFIVSIVLARLLRPEVYGTVALIMVFINIMQVFVDSGLANALIQKKSADDADFSSVFYFNVVLCLVIYAVMYCIAPVIAGFYSDGKLVLMIRVLSLTIVLSGVKNVQQAYVSRTFQFKKFFWATLSGTLTSAFSGIVLAVRGFGVWAIIAQYLSNLFIDTLVLWIIVKWRPTLQFSFRKLRGLLSYGWKLLISALLETIYQNVWQLVIGKNYSSTDLAYYNQGNKLPNIIVSNINSSIDSILLPVMSKEQDDNSMVKSMTRRSIKTSVYIMAPLMIGLAATSHTVVKIILTERWLPCVPYLRILCLANIFMPIHTANLNAVKAVGRSDLFLKLEIIKKIVGFLGLLISAQFSVTAMVWSVFFISFISQIINAWPNKKLLHYGYIEQMKDILPSLLLSALMGLFVYPLCRIPVSDIVILVLQIIIGALTYLILSKIFKIDSFAYISKVIISCLKKQNSF